jgi:hypothetical protein
MDDLIRLGPHQTLRVVDASPEALVLRTEEMFRTIASGGVPDFLERFGAELRLAAS